MADRDGGGADALEKRSALLELTTDLVSSAMPDGTLTYLNRGGRIMLGWGEDEPLDGKRIPDVHPAWAAELVLEVGLPTALVEDVWRGEVAVLTRSGEEIPVSQVIVVHRDERGKPAYLSTIMRDIRDRKRVEEELRASTEMFQLVMDYIPQFVFWKDVDSVYRGCNENFARVAGVASPADIVGKTDHDLAWKAEEAAFFRQVDRKVMDSDTPELHIIEPQLQADGKQAWLDTNKIPLHDDTAKVVGILGTYEDITARKLAEDALIEREENLRILLDSIGDAVIATDAAGIVTRLNPVAEQLTGWSLAGAVGTPLAEVFRVECGAERRAIAEPFPTLLAGGALAAPTELRTLRDRGGGERVISERGAPMRNGDGEVIGLVLVFRDVTEQRALEEQLRHSRKMDSLGQLAGGIAHDFNNMLTAIAGCAEVLSRALREQPRLLGLAHNILDAADKAGGLTQKLLDFSRKGVHHREQFDVHRVIESACDLLERTIDRRVHVKVRLAAEVHGAFGDPSQLHNALLNLGLNARDAMPDGGTIAIATTNVAFDAYDCERSAFNLEPGAFVEIEVTDTGVGMADDVLQRAFEPFFTTKEVGAGTGLGLSAVYNAVVDNRGAIHVYSRPQRGTTFRLFLPVDADVTTGALDREPAAPSGRGTVLVVDDEATVREAASAMLRSLGYDVVEADGGPAALEVFARDHRDIDLVLLDMVMPTMTGRQVYRELLRVDADAAVVFTSGFTRETNPDFDEPGVRGFIKKPYRLAELAGQIASALARDRDG